MTPFTCFLTKYLPKPIALLVAVAVYTMILIVIVTLIGRDPNPMHYLDVG